MWAWIGLAVAAGPLGSLDDAQWEHVTDRKTDVGTVAVFRQRVGDVDCWQAKAAVSAAPEVLLEVATELDGAERWTSAHLVWSRVLERDEHHLVYAQYMEPPPVTMARPRYWVARGEIRRVGEGWQMQWQRLDARRHLPDLDDRVARGAIELVVNAGDWTFASAPSGALVRYRVCTDPGGKLPDWVQRLATRNTLPDNVASVVREARRRQRR